MTTKAECDGYRADVYDAIGGKQDAKGFRWIIGLIIGLATAVAAGLFWYNMEISSMANENRTLVMIEETKSVGTEKKLERIIDTQERMAETQQEILRRLPE